MWILWSNAAHMGNKGKAYCEAFQARLRHELMVMHWRPTSTFNCTMEIMESEMYGLKLHCEFFFF